MNPEQQTPPEHQPTQPPIAPPQTPQQPPPAQPTTNPGKVTGIVGIVLAFVFLPFIGLILSIVSTVKSHKAGVSSVLGVIGIVLNALALVVAILLIALTIVAYVGIQERAQESETYSNVNLLGKKAEAYYVLHDTYPQTLDAFEESDESSLTVFDDSDIRVIDTPPTDPHSIMYAPCGTDGAQIASYSVSTGSPTYTYLGSGSQATC